MSSCTGCTRRTLLQGLGLLTLSAKVGCGSDSRDPDGFDPVDAGPPDAPPEPPVPCEAGKFCVDLTRASSAPIQTVGGFLRVVIATDTLIIVRTGDTTFEVTSAKCTHKGCNVAYNGTVLRCPCHGSQFTLEGEVLMGPATTPLRAYEATYDATTSILTITV